uniref:Dehydrogenase E1 component domain-containing protein n=1 Tax=Piliocolobus tephrosceles TaxID=591936 RepID=A0A8C9GXQ8_9PRIM
MINTRLMFCFLVLTTLVVIKESVSIHKNRQSFFFLKNYNLNSTFDTCVHSTKRLQRKNAKGQNILSTDTTKEGVKVLNRNKNTDFEKVIDRQITKESNTTLNEILKGVDYKNILVKENYINPRPFVNIDKKKNMSTDFNIYFENNKLEEYILDIPISKEELCMLYEDMFLGRMFENLVAKLYYVKKIKGFVHLYNGQEAISSGEQIPIAVGLGYSILYKKEFNITDNQAINIFNNLTKGNVLDTKGGVENVNVTSNTSGDDDSGSNKENVPDVDVVVCFLGDGTSNIGQFFESLNLSSIYNLPILFIIENNNWAIGMEGSRSSSNDLMNNYNKSMAFNIDTYKVDGNDVLNIYKLAKKKINEIRKRQSGPVLIEAITYRTRGHSLADPDELRISEEKVSWKNRDPITILSSYMKKQNIVQDSYFDDVKKN